MSSVHNIFANYQPSEEYVAKMKKRYPKSHLYIMYITERMKIQKEEKKKFSCYEKEKLWIKFRNEYGSSVVSQSLPESPVKDMDQSQSKLPMEKSSLIISTPELSLEHVKIK